MDHRFSFLPSRKLIFPKCGLFLGAVAHTKAFFLEIFEKNRQNSKVWDWVC
jgi:hypothetical protein